MTTYTHRTPRHVLATAGIGLLTLGVLTTPVDAVTYEVPGTFPTIQDAIDVCNNGDVVIVADGVYSGPGNFDLDFGGRLITVESVNGADACVIDCLEMGRAFVFQSGETSAAVVSGFTIRNGLTSDRGGAIFIDGAGPSLLDLCFEDNRAESLGPVTGNGGAIFCTGGNPLIEDCCFTGNTAVTSVPDPENPPLFDSTGLGGAILLTDGSDAMIVRSTFDANLAVSPGLGGNGLGGAIFMTQSNAAVPTLPSAAVVEDSTFTDNGAAVAGGAIWVQGVETAPEPGFGPSSLVVFGSTFTGNWGQSGGAIAGFSFADVIISDSAFFENFTTEEIPFFLPGVQEGIGGGAVGVVLFSSVSIEDSLFVGNHARAGMGGAVSTSFANTTTIVNSEFHGNVAALAGGGVANHALPALFGGAPASVQLDNVLLAANTSGMLGGGLFNGDASAMNVVNGTIVYNLAHGDGGGVANMMMGSTADFGNSIFWKNRSDAGPWCSQVLDGPGGVTINDSIVQRGWKGMGTNIVRKNPKFVSTHGHGLMVNDYRLRKNSLAIDAGNNGVVTVFFDLDGNPRIVGPAVDMGAYEYQD